MSSSALRCNRTVPPPTHPMAMGDWSEFSILLKAELKMYPYSSVNGNPWAPLKKPLSESTVALVSSAGLIRPGQEPFDKSTLGGDPSFREIPADTDLHALRDTHRSKSFDHSGYRTDPNLAFPLGRLRELAGEKFIGCVADTHYGFMGSLRLSPRQAERARHAEVDHPGRSHSPRTPRRTTGDSRGLHS